MASVTPASKTVSGFADLSLNTPTKPIDLTQKLTAANGANGTQTKPEDEPVEEYRTRFVGDVDLDEKDEPLLKESQRRFVLFPIQYHEVCTILTLQPALPTLDLSAIFSIRWLTNLPHLIDLANVQES